MGKKYKNGLTLIEVIVGVMLFSIILTLYIFITSRLNIIAQNNSNSLEQTIFVNNCYELFCADPANFKENLSNMYGGNWDEYSYVPSDMTNFEIKHYEDVEFIYVLILKDKEVEEEWVRKKVIA